MLKNWTPPKQKDKQDIKAELKALRERLLGLQQPLRDRGLPVIVLVEGWAAAGKGSLINELIREIDPRFFGVVSPVLPPETEDRYPFLYRYAREIPENGKIMFYDSGWMEGAVRRYLRREITEKEFRAYVRSVTEFERQLRDGGYLVIKLFLHIDKGEQRDRIRALKENYETEWRVTEEDIWQHREYKLFLEAYDSFMEMTDKPVSWHILDGSRRKSAVRDENGKAVYASAAELKEIRSCFGLVFQNFNLFPHYTVLKNITEAPLLIQKREKAEVLQSARDLLSKMGLSGREDAYPYQLSGGQQQRVSIARALAMRPKILFFDEPTSALDPELTGEILKVIRALAAEHMTMVIVTHEMAFARDVSDHVIFMDGGVIVEQGEPNSIINNPTQERTIQFLSRFN